jgi:hypothetical protein
MLQTELLLAAQCCWQSENTQQQRIQLQAMAKQATDPAKNWQAIQQHRLWGLAAQLMDDATGKILVGAFWPTLLQKARQQKLMQLQLMAQTNVIEQAFQHAHIGLSVLKGPALSQRIYGDPAYRHSKDIDLLVAPADLWPATEVLLSLGFELDEAFARDPAQHQLVEQHFWHLTFQHAVHRVIVELHWRIELVHSPSKQPYWLLPFPADRITPAEFLYLITHGVRHHWFRLKWLGDIIAISERHPDIWQTSKPLMQQLNLQDQVLQTWQVIRWLLPDFPLPTLDALQLTESKHSRFMTQEVIRFLSEANYPEVTGQWPIAQRIRILRYQYCLHQRYSKKEQCLFWLQKSFFNAKDIEAYQFSTNWQWMYPWITLPCLIYRWYKTRTQLHPTRENI